MLHKYNLTPDDLEKICKLIKNFNFIDYKDKLTSIKKKEIKNLYQNFILSISEIKVI